MVTFYDSGCQVTRTATTNSSGYVDMAAPYGIYTISTTRSTTTLQIPNLTNNSSGLTECIYRGSSAPTTQTGGC
ncbi:MAG: hypothetical protein ACXVHJ_05530 [Solirubrobacteraceae bacterium]